MISLLLILLTTNSFASIPTPQIFEVSSPGMAPAGVHVTAMPDVQDTVPLTCPTIPGYTGDLENAPVTVWALPTTTPALKLQISQCLRKRDQAYADYTSNHYLGGVRPTDAKISWNFGDQSGAYNTVSGFNASHIYNTPGTYTLTLTVKTKDGQAQVTKAITVAPDTRKAYFIDSVAGSDANVGTIPSAPWKTVGPLLKLPIGNKNVQFKNGQTHVIPAGVILPLGSNDWFHSYGTPGTWANLQLQSRGIFFKFDPGASHMMVSGVRLDALPPAIIDPISNVYGQDVVFRNIATNRVNTGWEIQGFAFNHQTQGILIQDSGNKPVNGVWNKDFSSSYFVFSGGKQVSLYGNWIKVQAPIGQPVVRTCGTKVQDFAMVSNHIFGDVGNKHDPVSIRNGRNIYLSNNTIYSGDANFGARCSPNSGPNEAVNNSVIENNTFEDARLAIEEANLNVRASNNFFRQNNPQIADLTSYDNIVISGSRADLASTTGVVIDHNTAVNEYATGRMASFFTTDPKSIEWTNNNYYSLLGSNTSFSSISFQSHSDPKTSQGLFTHFGGNTYYLKLPAPFVFSANGTNEPLSWLNSFASPADKVVDITTVTIPRPDAGVPK